MLRIQGPDDLLKYLKARHGIAQRQAEARSVTRTGLPPRRVVDQHAAGQVYAYEEAIKAVEAMLTHHHEEEPE